MKDISAKVLRRVWCTLRLAALKFVGIDGDQRAAAFAYSAFFALFPTIILFVTVVSFFIERGEAAGVVISYLDKYLPAGGGMQSYVFDAVSHVIKARGKASAVASVMLIWAAAQFFTTLIQAANRAWGTTGNHWWKLPLKSLALLAITSLAVLTGIAVPVIGKMAGGLLTTGIFLPFAYQLWLFFVPWILVFFSLVAFYKLAPHRRTKYAEVWLSALCATVLLHAAQSIFVFYLRHFATFSAVYGAFGGLMALILWIYVSGIIFIFCACLGAAQASTRGQA